jgi:SAM-dependent methyltransferase
MELSEEARLQRARTFDQIADLYDQGRREPPGWLYDTVFAESRLDTAAARVLEIGCGTGKSTVPMARRGASILALEMGANLARLAQHHLASFPKAEVLCTRFEDWRPTERFDLVLAITAWHWLDPAVRYGHAAAALRPGGTLAFTVTEHAYPRGYDSFFEEIQECYRAVGMGSIAWPPPQPDAVADSRAEIEQSGCFEDVRVIRRLWAEEFTAEEHVALMRTASDHRLLEAEKREWLFEEMRRRIERRPGGRVRKDNLTLVHLARRLPNFPNESG